METKNQSSKPSFPSLEQAVKSTNNFVDALISRLLSSNGRVIQNVMQLINTLILTFALSNHNSASQLFEDFRDAGLLRNVAQIFENKPLAASCSPQLYDLQEIVRAVFHQNSAIPVDTTISLHRKSLKQVEIMLTTLIGATQAGEIDWQRAGLNDGQDPVSEFNLSLKWSGIQDFSDFLSQDDMLFKKMYLEHLAFAVPSSRFPLTQASLAVSAILYEIFGINDHVLNPEYLNSVPESLIPSHFTQPDTNTSSSMIQDSFNFGPQSQTTSSMLSPTNSSDIAGGRKMASNNTNSSGGASSAGNTASSLTIATSPTNTSNTGTTGNGGSSVETELAKLGKLRPLFFEWSTLLSAGIINFLRLWISSNAQVEDFGNIKEVVKILFHQAIPNNDFSTVSIDSVVTKLDTLSYTDIRAIQLRNIEEDLNNHWGYEIRSLHNQFHQESYDFVKEQRIRLLLRGEWFYVDNPTNSSSTTSRTSSGGTANSSGFSVPTSRRYFVALSPSLSTLHYSEYPQRLDEFPSVDALARTIDLSSISKVVVTSLSPNAPPNPNATRTGKDRLRVSLFSRINYSRISLIFSGSRDSSSLTFYTDTPEKAAAWGDGLLMLKNKPYQSSETKKYVEMFAETKLRLQMLQVTPSDLEYARQNKGSNEDYENVFPSDDYYYAWGYLLIDLIVVLFNILIYFILFTSFHLEFYFQVALWFFSFYTF